MSEPIYLDTETCGLHGMPVLLQTAKGDGEIQLYSLWKHKIQEVLDYLEEVILNPGGVIGFNLAFDWFQLSKIYTTFLMGRDKYGKDIYPEDYVEDLAVIEADARDGPCIKPYHAFDLMLHARKGPYQSLMNRDDIRIRRVPTALAWELAKELDKRIPLHDIYFARSKNKGVEKFKVYDVKDEDGNNITDFKDIVCKFSPSTALKALAVHALKVKEEEVLKFADIECNAYPEEFGYAPFALSVGEPSHWNDAWPEKIRFHITHWGYNDLARRYAQNDIVYTRGLYHEWNRPAMDDHDSILACQVASVRWRGLKVNIDQIKNLREEAIITSNSCVKAGEKVKNYLKEVMNAEEYLTIQESTKKIILEDIRDNWAADDGGVHPAATRAREVLEARKAKKEVEVYDKLIKAGRFHCSFVVIGTRSSRMSGADGLNPQGINHSKKVRSCFPFAWDGMILSGGDFSSFEVSLAAAVYKDAKLDEDLKLGKKMAGLFGQTFFPEVTYEDILESEGDDEEDMYDLSKRGMYQFFYGGTPEGMAKKLGFDVDQAKNAVDLLMARYPGIGRARKRMEDMFCSIKQPGGIGTNVEWHEPADYIESPLGFRRYFTLENMICKELFSLATKPPKGWQQIKVKVVRRDRMQTCSGATQSALYGAAFQIQAGNFRAGANHEIQCFGSQITKAVQVRVWQFQPCGVAKWHVMPVNVHDEVDVPCLPEIKEEVKKAVLDKIEEYRPMVPLIKMKWETDMPSWKGKV